MINKEVKVKSYQVQLYYGLILFAVASFVIFVFGLIICGDDYGKTLAICIMLSVTGFWLLLAFITRFFCHTYDIYSENGVKRIRGRRVVFDIKWSNVKSIQYSGFEDMIILCPFSLYIVLKEPIRVVANMTKTDYESIYSPISKKKLRLIEEVISVEIKY